MDMYETNTRLPRLRMEAVRRVRRGQGVREVARHFGYRPGTVSQWFTKRLGERGIAHCRSRVRTPTDNAHAERFIQTLQKECLDCVSQSMQSWRRAIPEYLRYYNEERPHMALGMKTPLDILKVFPRY